MVIMSELLTAAPQLTNWIGKLMYAMYGWIGNFGWTVVVFTIFLKIVVSPFDIWQKVSTRKNNRAMKIMKPELDRINAAYADNPQVKQKKTSELYKKHGYSMMGACLPSLLTLVIFFIVFSGFNACVKYEEQLIVYDLAQTYKVEIVDTGLVDKATDEEIDSIMLKAYDDLQKNDKGQDKWKWLWIDNVFMPDTWADPVPDIETYTGTGMGKLNASLEDINFELGGTDTNHYTALMGPAMQQYNKQGSNGWKRFWDVKHWNGYLILPILSLALSILSNLLMRGSQPEQATQYDADGKPIKTPNAMKYMTWIMPIMIGIFSLFYSAAFCIYMFTNSLITVLINVIYNAATKKKDAAEDEQRIAAHYRRGQ